LGEGANRNTRDALAPPSWSVTPLPTPALPHPSQPTASHEAGGPVIGETTADAAGVALIDSEAELDRAIAALAERDPDLVAHLLAVGGRPPLRRRAAGFEGLAAMVVSQQVSTASAAAIFGRLRAALHPFEAATLLGASETILRGAGLSAGKILTLRAVAAAIGDGRLRLEDLAGLPADEAVAKLTAIRGIGPWTAQLYLLSCLGHADAWPPGDIALEEAARLALGLEARPDRIAMARIAERWRPHRAVAARLLWGYYRARKARDGWGIGLGDG
jgi:DNA-3-methyladenine glycosylase II